MHACRAGRCRFPAVADPSLELAAECTHSVQGAANSPPGEREAQSRNLKAARISATKLSGCSKAAKCPPTSVSFQYLMSV